MKELKRYFVDIDEDKDDDGINKISLVKSPAFQRKFTAYSDESVRYSIVDEEERLVFGPVIIANQDVLRNDPPFGWHYTYYTPGAIKRIAYKYFREKHITDVNIHHTTDIDGVYMVESIFKDQNRVVPVGYSDLPDGTWFASFRVDNDSIWDQIKAGTFEGFSMEIKHLYIDSGDTVKTKIPNIKFNYMSTTKKPGAIDAMRMRSRYRTNYYASFGQTPKRSKYESVETDSGTIATDGPLAKGSNVMLFTADNEPIMAPDGTYTITSGDHANETFTVVNGVVESTSWDETSTEENVNIEMEEPGMPEAPASPEGEAAAAEAVAEVSAIESLVGAIDEHLVALEDKVEAAVTESTTSLMSQVKSLYSAVQSIQKHLKLPVETPAPDNASYNAPDTTNYANESRSVRGAKRLNNFK